MLFLVIPASVILLVLRIPVVRIVYGVSNFPWEATVKTSYALAFFSISIFAQSSVYLLTRAFYALKDTKTPVIVSSVTIIINIVLSLLFIKVYHFGVWSIALSYSITSIIDAVAMLLLLSKKLGGFDPKAIIIPFTKISAAAVLMGISLYAPLKLLDQYVFDTTKTINLLALTAIAGTLGIAVYLLFTKLFKVGEIQMFYKLLRRLNLMEQKDISSDATVETQP
jgi:putative peptidoglycan lipid II flippase